MAGAWRSCGPVQCICRSPDGGGGGRNDEGGRESRVGMVLQIKAVPETFSF